MVFSRKNLFSMLLNLSVGNCNFFGIMSLECIPFFGFKVLKFSSSNIFYWVAMLIELENHVLVCLLGVFQCILMLVEVSTSVMIRVEWITEMKCLWFVSSLYLKLLGILALQKCYSFFFFKNNCAVRSKNSWNPITNEALQLWTPEVASLNNILEHWCMEISKSFCWGRSPTQWGYDIWWETIEFEV